MKEKSFYVINLDNKRLFIVSLSVAALMASFFALGYRLGGQNMAGQQNQAALNTPIQPKLQMQDTPLETASALPTMPPKEDNLTLDLSSKSQLPPSSGDYPPVSQGKIKEYSLDSSQSPDINDSQAKIPPVPVKKKSPAVSAKKKASATAPAPVSAAPSSSGGKKYTIQIAAFKTLDRAKKARSELSAKSIKSYIAKSSTYYFVRKGRAASKSSLEGSVQTIRSKTSYKPIIIKSAL